MALRDPSLTLPVLTFMFLSKLHLRRLIPDVINDLSTLTRRASSKFLLEQANQFLNGELS